jgi:hypothetical protein
MGGDMKKPKVLLIFAVVVVLLWLLGLFSLRLFAAESRGQAGVRQELTKEIGMPLLDGTLWQKMTPDDKIAFFWGFWHVIAIDNYLAEKYPQLKAENFSKKVSDATNRAPMTINQIVGVVDKYYQEHPDEMGKQVIAVLWGSLIKPNIDTGIAGRPLNR